MRESVSILLVAIGGYGNFYVNALLDNAREYDFHIAGIVDPYPDGCRRLSELKSKGIPFYQSIEEFYASSEADLAVISSPIHYHADQVCQALDHGSNVLCEKPLCSTMEDAKRIIDARERAGRFVSVGYQWSYSDAIQQLKADILGGLLGKPKRFKAMVLWPRDFAYYHRNNWAGKVRGANGTLVLDSVANNATAHYIHNLFYLLGATPDQSARPMTMQAEVYKANDIETYDTVAFRARTENQVEILYYASHAVETSVEPKFELEFEHGIVMYDEVSDKERNVRAVFPDGKVKEYGDPFHNVENKLWYALDAVRGQRGIACGPEAALAQMTCVGAIHAAVPQAPEFPASLVRHHVDQSGTPLSVYVEGLGALFEDCYERGRLPHEMNLPWTHGGKERIL